MRIVITGVTGFVGCNLVKHLSSLDDYLLLGHSRDEGKAKKLVQQYKIEMIKELSSSGLNELKIDAVIHLAGIAHDLSNHYQPQDYYKVNEEGTKKVYDEFLHSKASKFIFVSSIKAAVDSAEGPVTEEINPHPVTDYGKSKWKAEQYIQSKPLPPGKHFYILRPCMIHGPGNKGNLNVLYRFVKSGIPYPLGAFENQRSFLSSDNFNFVVEQFLRREIPSGIYNLADEGYLSTKELIQIMAGALGKHPKILNINKKWITCAAAFIRQENRLSKLTENMMVSNQKLLKAIPTNFPVTLREGLLKTIKSFYEQ